MVKKIPSLIIIIIIVVVVVVLKLRRPFRNPYVLRQQHTTRKQSTVLKVLKYFIHEDDVGG
jgi:t-SNARE complex subunit (syntaxin)